MLININNCRLMALPWFLQRCWQFCPQLLLPHQCKCQPSEKGKSRLTAVKIISSMPALVTADPI